MVDPKASRFWQAALQSGLIDVEALQDCFEAIVPEKRVAEHIDRRLAKQAVQTGKLTLWQAQQLLAGRSSGFKIHRYTLLEMIGQGGMGRVYLARDTRLNRRVAVKILSHERMNNPRAIARFQREARVGAQLQHENLVRIYDEGEANGKCYLVMEYIEGKNIGAIIAENGPIPPAIAARLTQQVALGLEHAQQKGLIHRDVNPYNILVTREGIAKLTDLGLAIDQSEQGQVTREGATVGTFDYVSPEQARHSHSVDARSDIYSLGCTLYHMLSAQVPFPCPSLPEKLFGHQTTEPLPLTRLVPGIPEGLAKVVEKMMRKSPDARYPTPLDVAHALEPYTDNPAGTPGPVRARSSRGVGRAAMSETQVFDGPEIASGSTPSLTEVATRLIEGAPSAAVSAPLSSSASSSATTPSPVQDPASGSPSGTSATGGGSASRSNESWDVLNLGIDLGPEPSLTEGLQSRKKKPRSSTDLSAESASESAAATSATPASASSPLPTPLPVTPIPPSPSPEGADATPTDRATAAPVPAVTDGLAGLGLTLDLGPEPTLSTSTRAKAPPPRGSAGPDTAAVPSPSSTPRGPGRRPVRRWLIAVGALGAAAAVAGVLFGFVLGRPGGTSRSSSPPGGVAKPSSPDPEGTRTPGVTAKTDRAASRKDSGPEVPADQPIAVKTRDGVVVPEPNLKSAMQRAIGSHGHVLLNNREPIRLTGKDAAITISGGPLFIRAAAGVRPVLEVELKGEAPFLSTRTETPLTIEGVTIVARYGGKPRVTPPVIQAGGNITLERCAFAATGAVQGSRAVAAEGSKLTVNGCWFEGFDAALDVAAFAGSSTTIQQSMMVRAATDVPSIGWALRVRSTPGGNTRAARRLVMDHCTVKGEGLLHLVDFSPEAPFRVDLRDCAVMADAVLAWETPKPGTPLTAAALDWKGERNQYDIRGKGKAWVVQSPAGTPELPDGPTDLASWRSKMPEHDPIPPPIRFRVPPESLSESPRPRDFGIVDQDIHPPGADPVRVGPP